MEGVVRPPPARRAAAQGVPVIGMDRGPDIQEVGLYGIFDNHTQFIHGISPFPVAMDRARLYNSTGKSIGKIEINNKNDQQI
jgi:hypothetical protein